MTGDDARNLARGIAAHGRAVTVCDLYDLYIALGGALDRIGELEARPRAGRPPGSLNKAKS